MKFLYLTLIILIGSVVNAQSYYNAELTFTDGTTKTGYAKVPNGDQKNVSFKNTLEEKPSKINSDDLFTIIFRLDNMDEYVLERNSVKIMATKKNGELYTSISKKRGWFLQNHAHKKLNFYTAGQRYKIDNDGDFNISSSGQVGFTGIGYYFKRPSEENVTYITAKMSGIQVNHEKLFRNAASTYLSDHKKLVERINNEEFKSYQLDEIYAIYISD